MNRPRYLFFLIASVLVAVAPSVVAAAETDRPTAPLVLDMVHHNPGEARYKSQYNDPASLAANGYNGKVYFLFDSPTLAVDWASVDPEVFPPGSPGRKWVDDKAAMIDLELAKCSAAGIEVYALSDLVLLPKVLVERRQLEKTFGDPSDPQTEKLLRQLIAQVFERFPKLGGLVVRIGETYLHDAPFHVGHIANKTNAEKTIIPLLQILRDEVSVKRNRLLVFRTWMSFDTDLATYSHVSDSIDPHPRLVIGVKHCENDFHRGNAFSKVIGHGRHPQLIEVQCAREYEGKGAYPNYIAHGVIDGFEEHRRHPHEEIFHSIGEFARTSPLYAGVWTWSRGGGWDGPYIKNELWCELNAFVMAQWAHDPTQSEEAIFNRFATERLGLHGAGLRAFRRLCILSADAVVRGKSSTARDLSPWWSRDDAITRPEIPANPERRARLAKEQDEAVALWEEIVQLADQIQPAEAADADYLRVSARYGLFLFRIYRAVVALELLGPTGDPLAIRARLADYDGAWSDLRQLAAQHPTCATLYDEDGGRWGASYGIDALIASYRKRIAR